jgi:hypothetical protein
MKSGWLTTILSFTDSVLADVSSCLFSKRVQARRTTVRSWSKTRRELIKELEQIQKRIR